MEIFCCHNYDFTEKSVFTYLPRYIGFIRKNLFTNYADWIPCDHASRVILTRIQLMSPVEF